MDRDETEADQAHGLAEIVENESTEDEVLFLKPGIELAEPEVQPEHEGFEMEVDPGEDEPAGEPRPEPPWPKGRVVWARETESEPVCLAIHPGFPQTAHVAVGTCGDSCVVLDLQTGNEGRCATSAGSDGELVTLGPFGETVACAAFSPSGALLGLGCLDGSLFVYAVTGSEYRVTHKFEKVLASVEWVAFAGGAANLLAAGGDGGLVLWRGEEPQVLPVGPSSLAGGVASYPPAGPGEEWSHFVVCGAGPGVSVLPVDATGAPAGPSRMVASFPARGEPSDPEGGAKERPDAVLCIGLHARLKICGFGTDSGGVGFANLAKRTLIAGHPEAHEGQVEAVKFGPGENQAGLCCSAGLDGNIVLYDMANDFAVIRKIEASPGLTRLALHPTRSLIFAASIEGKIFVAGTREIAGEVWAHEAAVLDLALLDASGDFYAISVGLDKRVAISGNLEGLAAAGD